jgi:hypothetical protein
MGVQCGRCCFTARMCHTFASLLIQQGELLVYVRARARAHPHRGGCPWGRPGRITDDLVLGRMLRVVDDEDVDTVLCRLNLES